MAKDIICGLDIGTSKICLTCGTCGSEGQINILANCVVPTQELAGEGIIENQRLSAYLKEARDRLRKRSGLKVKHVYANIDIPDLQAEWAQASASFAQTTRIKKAQVAGLIDSCVYSHTSLGRKVIHIGFRNFIIDNRSQGCSPQGELARDLKLDIVVVSAPVPAINRIIKCLKQAGLVLEGIAPSSCAQALGLIRGFAHQAKKDYILIDIGAGFLKLAVFRDRLIRDIMILPVGGGSITNDIATRLKLSFSCAEGLKKEYGRAFWEERQLQQKIVVKDRLNNKIIQPRELYEIVSCSADYLLHKIKDGLLKLDYRDGQDCEIIFTGGGAILEGFLEKAEQLLARPLRMGSLACIDDNYIQGQSSLYSTSIGLIYLGFANIDKNYQKVFAVRTNSSPFAQLSRRIQLLYREYF